MNETRKLPLWRNVVLILEEQGVTYTTIIKTEWLEDQLACSRNDTKGHFGFAIAKIRKALEHHGLYLTCRGQQGKQYIFVPASENYTKLQKYQRAANDALKRGVILGTNTQTDVLAPKERELHEKWCANLAMRRALMERPASILKLIQEKQPQKKIA
jgi:hypothetical protein